MGGAGRREPGRGLHELGAGRLGQVAGADLLVIGQVGVLEDDLHDRAAGMGDVDDGLDVGPDVGIPAGLQGADLDDHVQFGRPIGQRALGFEDLGGRQVVAMRKPDRRSDLDVRAVQDGPGPEDVGRADTHGRHVVAGRQPAAILDERVVQFGAQEGMVDRLGDVTVGQSIDAQGHHAHLM